MWGGCVRNALDMAAVKQFVSFAAVGIISFAVDWLLLVALTDLLHIDYLISTSISFLVSVALNYALSMKYVFEHRDDISRRREFTIFAILSAVGLGLTDVLMFAGVAVLNIAYQAMKVIATFCVTWYNFITRRKFLSATS